MRNLLLLFTLLMIGCEGGPDGVVGGIIESIPTIEAIPEISDPTNSLPVTVTGSVTTAFNTTISISLSATDDDGDDLTYYLVDQPAHGDITCTDQACSFIPETGYSGSDSFTFLVNDGTDDSNTSTVSVSIGTNPDSCSGDQNPYTVDSSFTKNSSGVLGGSLLVTCTGTYLIPSVIYDNGMNIVRGVYLTYTTSDGGFRACYYKATDKTGSGQNRFILYYTNATSNCENYSPSQTNIDNKDALLSGGTYLNSIKSTYLHAVKF